MKRRKLIVANDVLLPLVCEDVRRGKQVVVTVRGNSMNPIWVDRRDQVVLAAFAAADLRPGTVVLAQQDDNRFLLHRIVGVQGEQVVLMGDGNLRTTECVRVNQIKAKAAGYIRNGKKGSCSGLFWRLYSRSWVLLRPLRRGLLAIWRMFN